MRGINSNLFHAIAIGILLLVVIVSAARAADLTVSNAWVRAMPRAVPSGAYFTITNATNQDVVLTGAQTPACGSLLIHKSEFTGGICRMRDLAEIDVPAGETIAFAPSGYHLMCEHAKPSIRPGAVIPVTLKFKGGKRLSTNFAVKNASGR